MIRKLYLDSANLDEIRRWLVTDAVAGFTTNPSLMAKEEKGDYVARLLTVSTTITQARPGTSKHLSVEVTTVDPRKMLDEALRAAEVLANISTTVDHHIKVPITADTLSVISDLAARGVRVNATAAFTAAQAKMAEDAGAHVVSFFYNRMRDRGVDAEHEISLFCGHLRRSAQVICGSIREPKDVLTCWLNGSDFVTASSKVIEGLTNHPGTEASVKQFAEDIERWRE